MMHDGSIERVSQERLAEIAARLAAQTASNEDLRYLLDVAERAHAFLTEWWQSGEGVDTCDAALALMTALSGDAALWTSVAPPPLPWPHNLRRQRR